MTINALRHHESLKSSCRCDMLEPSSSVLALLYVCRQLKEVFASSQCALCRMEATDEELKERGREREDRKREFLIAKLGAIFSHWCEIDSNYDRRNTNESKSMSRTAKCANLSLFHCQSVDRSLAQSQLRRRNRQQSKLTNQLSTSRVSDALPFFSIDRIRSRSDFSSPACDQKASREYLRRNIDALPGVD